jgi:hypothetical protein
MSTTYLGSGDASTHRRDYRPEWLDNLADDVTIEGSVLTGIARDPMRSGQSSALRGRCTTIRSSTSSALTETTGSSRTTRRWCEVSRSAAS